MEACGLREDKMREMAGYVSVTEEKWENMRKMKVRKRS